MIKCVCENCGKEYEVMPYRIKEGSKYCSRKCFYEALKKSTESRVQKGICIFCGKEFEWLPRGKSRVTRNYCSSACCVKHNNQKQREQRIKCICLYCGKTFERPISRIKLGEYKYCSHECATNDRLGISFKPRKKNEILYEKDYAYMILEYKGETRKVLFDKEDEEKIKKYYWILTLRTDRGRKERPVIFANRYVTDGEKEGHINFWRYIMDYDGELQIDHINRNPLDNRKNNLRIVTAWENAQNKEKKYGYSGICFFNNKYRADIVYQGKKKFLGNFKTLEEAIEARKQAEKELGCH